MQHGAPLSPYHSPEGVSFEGKAVPDHLMPARLIIFPSTDPDESHWAPGVPAGHTAQEGMSFSYTCGLVACIWQKYPELSANAMRWVMHTAARSAEPRFGLTKVGMPTWESIETAIASLCDHQPDTGPIPFAEYDRVQAMSWSNRIDAIRRDPDVSSDVLLNSLPQRAPRKYRDMLISLCAEQKNPRTRAALILLVQPHEDDQSSCSLLSKALEDSSTLVLGCALDLLRRQPSLMKNHVKRVSELINHHDDWIRVEALLAVEESPDRVFVDPLIDGMEHDFEKGPLDAFYVRKSCLEKITGQDSFQGAGRMRQPGESIYSDYWTSIRKRSVSFWKEYAEQNQHTSVSRESHGKGEFGE